MNHEQIEECLEAFEKRLFRLEDHAGAMNWTVLVLCVAIAGLFLHSFKVF
jgi:hypothetical protein